MENMVIGEDEKIVDGIDDDDIGAQVPVTGHVPAPATLAHVPAIARTEPHVNNFETIKSLRLDMKMIFDELTQKINALHALYKEMVKTHEEQNYTFGLDSFFFQNKLISMEYNNMQKIFAAIDNRMYCEYYKLYRLVLEYITDEIKEPRVLQQIQRIRKTFPVYKDLEPSKEYDFSLTCEVQHDILLILNILEEHLNIKTAELGKDKSQSDKGLHIENIVNVQQFQTALINERIYMFLRYLDAFHAHHSKYLCRLTLKSKLMIGVVNEDIRLKQSVAEVNVAKKTLTRKSSAICHADKSTIKHFVQYNQAASTIQSTLDTIIEHSEEL